MKMQPLNLRFILQEERNFNQNINRLILVFAQYFDESPQYKNPVSNSKRDFHFIHCPQECKVKYQLS